MKPFKLLELKSALKKLLKKRGLSYQDLANELDCSVPTVKRWLGQEELSVSRLLDLCELLDVSLGELELMTEKKEASDAQFTPEQERFLAKNAGHFAYLMALFKGDTPKAIAERHGLSARSTDKYLIALEKNNLIRVTGKQRVKPAFKDVPRLHSGPLARQYHRAILDSAAKFFTREIDEALRESESPRNEKKSVPKGFGVLRTEITEKTYRAWMERFERDLQELERQASFEQKSHEKGELKSMVMLRANALVDEERVQILESFLGEIPNL